MKCSMQGVTKLMLKIQNRHKKDESQIKYGLLLTMKKEQLLQRVEDTDDMNEEAQRIKTLQRKRSKNNVD